MCTKTKAKNYCSVAVRKWSTRDVWYGTIRTVPESKPWKTLLVRNDDSEHASMSRKVDVSGKDLRVLVGTPGRMFQRSLLGRNITVYILNVFIHLTFKSETFTFFF